MPKGMGYGKKKNGGMKKKGSNRTAQRQRRR